MHRKDYGIAGSNFDFEDMDPKKIYELWVGDVRYCPINQGAVSALQKEYNGRIVEPIYVLTNNPPLWFSEGFKYFVINDELSEISKIHPDKSFFLDEHYSVTNAQFRNSPFARKLMERALRNQKMIYVNPFSQINFGIDDGYRIRAISPSEDQFSYWQDKGNVLKTCRKLGIKTPETDMAENFEHAVHLFREKYTQGAFVKKAGYSSGGSGNFIVRSVEELYKSPKFKGEQRLASCCFLVSEIVNGIISCPSITGVIGDEQIFIASINDQIIRESSGFSGSVHPSGLGKQVEMKILKMAKPKLEEMQKRGYRGIFNTDYIIRNGRNGETVLDGLDINPRKPGSILAIYYMNKLYGGKDIQEMEFRAVTGKPLFSSSSIEEAICYQPIGLEWQMSNIYGDSSTVIRNGRNGSGKIRRVFEGGGKIIQEFAPLDATNLSEGVWGRRINVKTAQNDRHI
ncbi:MAG: hypothetical protein JW716_00930 [Candidatus Aenigmarchaeota archaeon]|nr:hypothetical protein [Candidatus Aenigmarchaeota archaeon]